MYPFPQMLPSYDTVFETLCLVVYQCGMFRPPFEVLVSFIRRVQVCIVFCRKHGVLQLLKPCMQMRRQATRFLRHKMQVNAENTPPTPGLTS